MAKTTVTNTADGPRGVILKDGSTHFLEPNQSADLELHDSHELYEGVEKGESAAKKAAKAAAAAGDEAEAVGGKDQ
jgi:hypothetical protein